MINRILFFILILAIFSFSRILSNGNMISVGIGTGIEPGAKWVVYLTPSKYSQISFSGLKDFGKNDFQGIFNSILKVGDFDHDKFYNPFIGGGYGWHTMGGYNDFDSNGVEYDRDYSYSTWKVGAGSNFSFLEHRRMGVNLGLYYSFGVAKENIDTRDLEHYGLDEFKGSLAPSISIVFNFLRISDSIEF